VRRIKHRFTQNKPMRRIFTPHLVFFTFFILLQPFLLLSQSKKAVEKENTVLAVDYYGNEDLKKWNQPDAIKPEHQISAFNPTGKLELQSIILIDVQSKKETNHSKENNQWIDPQNHLIYTQNQQTLEWSVVGFQVLENNMLLNCNTCDHNKFRLIASSQQQWIVETDNPDEGDKQIFRLIFSK
jgi:hypothetical protein